jgi:hypothetical protein
VCADIEYSQMNNAREKSKLLANRSTALSSNKAQVWAMLLSIFAIIHVPCVWVREHKVPRQRNTNCCAQVSVELGGVGRL